MSSKAVPVDDCIFKCRCWDDRQAALAHRANARECPSEASRHRCPGLRLAPPELKARFLVDRANAGEFGVRFHEYEAAQTSTLFAGTHARGGANSFLWISEWGFVQCEGLRRSEEILTGAIPSANDGTIVVETTWRGGRGGHLWILLRTLLKRRSSKSSLMTGEWSSSPSRTTWLIVTQSGRRSLKRRFGISRTSPGSAPGK